MTVIFLKFHYLQKVIHTTEKIRKIRVSCHLRGNIFSTLCNKTRLFRLKYSPSEEVAGTVSVKAATGGNAIIYVVSAISSF